GGSSAASVRILRGSPNEVTKVPKRTMTAAASGATQSERFSHSSRRTDQYIGRVSGRAADSVAGPAGSSGLVACMFMVAPPPFVGNGSLVEIRSVHAGGADGSPQRGIRRQRSAPPTGRD